MIQSQNIKQGEKVYQQRLNRIKEQIKRGCIENGKNDFNNCCICQSDHSVQFHDISLTMMREDGIIDKGTENKIKAKLYDGHRG